MNVVRLGSIPCGRDKIPVRLPRSNQIWDGDMLLGQQMSSGIIGTTRHPATRELLLTTGDGVHPDFALASTRRNARQRARYRKRYSDSVECEELRMDAIEAKESYESRELRRNAHNSFTN